MIRRYLISIRNIPWTVSQSQLEGYFSTFGDVRAAKIIFDKNGLSTGYGFVEFYDNVVITNVLNKNHVLDDGILSITNGLKYLREKHIKEFVDKHLLDADTYSFNEGVHTVNTHQNTGNTTNNND